MSLARRSASLLAGLWAGLLVAIGALAAPAAFSVLASADAGRLVGRMLAVEGYASLGLAMVLFAIARRDARRAAAAGRGSVISAEMLLLLAALFCTVAGSFALPPLLEAARAGQGAYSFATLHRVATTLFGLKALVVVWLAWRWAGR